jgi:hypothetical protein
MTDTQLHSAPVMIIKRREHLATVSAAFDLLDKDGAELGSIRQVDKNVATKLFRVLTETGKNMKQRYKVRDAQDEVVLLVEEPSEGFLGGEESFVVTTPDETPVGEIREEGLLEGLREGRLLAGKLLWLVADGAKIGAVEFGEDLGSPILELAFGEQRDSSGKELERHQIVDHADNVVATVERRSSDDLSAKELFTTGSTYVMKRERELAEPLATLVTLVPFALDVIEQEQIDERKRARRRD